MFADVEGGVYVSFKKSDIEISKSLNATGLYVEIAVSLWYLTAVCQSL